MSKLLLSIMALGLLASQIAPLQAGEYGEQDNKVRTMHHNNFVGQRPYSKAPEVQAKGANQAWEGTGLVTQTPEEAEKALMKHNQLQLNFMGKRPYLAPHNAD